ncbi:hypothetical protein CRG98_031672 [Punica granatum]|uniref:Uncharacterized protein n=1 Tax=Punica granatum TaxID=22663 RepID=A0A2I0IV71_PUNGR|nr:hypothetical protein CRG98_031672 [Punica granatum]
MMFVRNICCPSTLLQHHRLEGLLAVLVQFLLGAFAVPCVAVDRKPWQSHTMARLESLEASAAESLGSSEIYDLESGKFGLPRNVPKDVVDSFPALTFCGREGLMTIP